MNHETIRVLLVEDNPGDARLIREMLAEAGETGTELECVDRLDAALKRLSSGGVDVLLLDLSLPDGQGIEVCARAHAQAPQVPIVVLTGLDDETKAIKTLRTGAQDYLVKGQVDSRLLVRSIRYAIERNKAEEALRESEEEYRSLFDHMLEGFAYCQIIVDENNRPVDFVYLAVNDAFERLTGLKKEDVTGKRVTEAIPGIRESKTDFFGIYGRVALAGEEARFEAYFEPLEKWLTISAYSPKKGFFVAVFDDITKRKVTEARSRQLQKELNLTSRLASLGEMAAGIAHEINNPLAGVIGFSEMLMEKDVPREIAQDLKVINENAQRVANIVRNMLTFARPHGKGKQYADINSIISRVLEVQAYELKTSNIQVKTELSPDLPWTLVDEGQIQQVLLNIITNAEQAMRRTKRKGRLNVTSQNQGGNILISITDNGKGIAAENLEKIFEPFFTTKEPGEGTGLGLSISYSIIREHDGRLYARSKPGHGTTFFIELPIVAEPQQLKLAESSQEEPRGTSGGKILVVDDEPDICRLISRLLDREGYKVETTLSARQALEKLSAERYRLILVDIKMPDISGIEFYRRVGRIARSIQKRIIFITGDTISTETEAFLQKTGATFINKPFVIKEFNQTVNKRLAESL